MNSEFPHPAIALLTGVLFAVIPILSIVKGTTLFVGFQKKSERPAFFWLGVVMWCIIVIVIVIGAGCELVRSNQGRSSNEKVLLHSIEHVNDPHKNVKKEYPNDPISKLISAEISGRFTL